MKIFYSFVLSLLCCQLYAQINLGKFGSDAFIDEAVRRGLFISCQSYQICDNRTGELFGLNGEAEFGIGYSLGIKVPGGYYLSDQAVRPWLYDKNFAKYQNKYKPVFYQAKYTELGEQVQYDSLDYSLANITAVTDSVLYRFASSTFNGKGFILDTEEGQKDGWAVWIVLSKDSTMSTNANLTFISLKETINVKKERLFMEILPPKTFHQLVGGIYVVAEYSSIGVVEFKLCGIIMTDGGDAWNLYFPFIGQKIENKDKTDAMAPSKNVGGNELTPVGKTKNVKKKNKKRK